MLNIYYFIPGQSETDDLTVLDEKGNNISFKDFKHQLGTTYDFINFNYPEFLIKNRILSAQIVSFHCNKFDCFARTAIVKKDKFGRHLPITEIITCDTPLSYEDLQKKWNNPISKQLNFPQKLISSELSTKHTSKIILKEYVNIKKITDWSREIEVSSIKIINIFENRLSSSGINACFNGEVKKNYSSFVFYDSAFHFKKKNLILLSLVLISFLIIIMTKCLGLIAWY